MALTQAQERKRELSSPPPAGDVSPAAKRPRQESQGAFNFLALPRELRDEVYKHVLDIDHSVTLQQRNFITKSGLIGVNNQICEEFLDAVLFYAPRIQTTVRNHNFAHVVTFLNRLSEAQFKRFSKDAVDEPQRPTPRHGVRKIQIMLQYSPTKTSTKAQLNRWLDRFDDPNRRGAEIDFRYVIDRETWGCGGYKQRPSIRSTAGERSNEEVRKIISARHSWKRRGEWMV